MQPILKTTDPVTLGRAESLLTAEGIPCVVFDRHTSIVQGSLGILPCRLMVADEDLASARRLLTLAGVLDAGPAPGE